MFSTPCKNMTSLGLSFFKKRTTLIQSSKNSGKVGQSKLKCYRLSFSFVENDPRLTVDCQWCCRKRPVGKTSYMMVSQWSCFCTLRNSIIDCPPCSLGIIQDRARSIRSCKDLSRYFQTGLSLWHNWQSTVYIPDIPGDINYLIVIIYDIF